MERIINTELLKYLRQHNLISQNQHGFLKRRSTCTNLLDCLNDWTLSFRDKSSVDVIYIDFKKAFDSVSHNKLLLKLEAYGIADDALSWIQAFLSNRTQSVRILNAISIPLPVRSGVPQGSVLGPTLFLLFINDVADLFSDLSVKLSLYADDIKLYSTYCSDLELADLDNALDRLTAWADLWQLPISETKCFALHLSPIHSISPLINNHIYLINSNPLKTVASPRDLGVIVDTHLAFSKHISSIASAAHRRASLLLRCFCTKDYEVLMRAFNTYVRPLLEYCSPVWSPHLLQDIRALESVQRRFTKRLRGMSSLSYPQRMSLLGIKSLQYRRIISDLSFCFNLIKGQLDLDATKFLTLKGSNSLTRGHPLHIVKQHVRTDTRKFFFTNRVITCWNSLPDALLDSGTIASFKRGLRSLDLTVYCLL